MNSIFAPAKAYFEREQAKQDAKVASFEVIESDTALILVKRLYPITTQMGTALVVSAIWSFASWYAFTSPGEQNTWIGWKLLWILAPIPFCIRPVRDYLRVHKGERWSFDRISNSLNYNDEVVTHWDQLEFVEVEIASGSEESTVYGLKVYLKNETSITLDTYGSKRELIQVGRKIAEFITLPFKHVKT